MWTCIECDGNYDSNSGDTDERTCNECIDKDSFISLDELPKYNTLAKEPKKQGIPIFAEFHNKEEQDEAYNMLYESLPKSGDTRFMLVLFMVRLPSTAILGYSNDNDTKKEGK